MALRRTAIGDIVTGTNKTIIRTIVNVPVGLTMTEAWLTVKENITKPDANAEFQKHITTVSSGDGQLANGADQSGTLTFLITQVDTAKLTKRQYEFDIQIKLSDNKKYPGEIGVILPRRGMTQAN